MIFTLQSADEEEEDSSLDSKDHCEGAHHV